jgi:hypothetical protein
MKRISKNKWTDGEHIYEGTPRTGFKQVGDSKRAKEIVEQIRQRKEDETVVESGPVQLKPVEVLDEKPVDTGVKE